MHTRALALICIFPGGIMIERLRAICAWACLLLLLLLFLNATAADAAPSRPCPTAAVSPSPPDVFHNVCVEISDHPPPFNRRSWRPLRISYAPRGRADLVFGTAPLAGGASRPVTRTPATALYNNGPRSICASFYLPSSCRHCFFDRQIRCTMDQYPIHIILQYNTAFPSLPQPVASTRP